MTAPTLRGYQTKAIEDIRAQLRRVKRVCLQSPTASGKTVLTSYMIREAAGRGLRTIFCVHRKELMEQTSRALWDLDVPHGLIAAGKIQTDDQVQVATIQTLVRRLGKVQPWDMLVIDEAHHTTATSYRKVVDHRPDAWVVGLTATPARTDGTGLGDIFDALVEGPTVGWLIEHGFLSPYRIIAPAQAMDTAGVHKRGGDFVRSELEVLIDQRSIIGDAVAHYKKYVAPGSCLVYCVSRLHARHVTEGYRKAGIDARYVAGDTKKDERVNAIAGFQTGNPPVIVSVDLFGEGLDVPGLQSVQLLRPTQSLGLHLQQVGRGLRVEKGKKALVVLDHVGNSWRHGLPDDLREWTLEGKKKGRGTKNETGPDLRYCEECFAIFAASLQKCPICGKQYTPKVRLPAEEDGELKEIEAEEHRRQRMISRKREEGMARSLEDLVALAKKRGYKAGWAAFRHASRQGIKQGTPQFWGLFHEAKRLWEEVEV